MKRNIQPQDICTPLPKNVASYLLNYRELIEKSPAELGADDTSRLPAKPYWDPTLRGSRPLLLQFLYALHAKGFVGLRRRIKRKIDFFFLGGKDGNHRLLVDARLPNASMQPPPITCLASAQCMAELDLSPQQLGSGTGPVGLIIAPAGNEGDVGDCFYNFTFDPLASWFGVDVPFGLDELIDYGF